jgi:TIR domain
MAVNPLSIFISYARTDSSFTDRLEADLQARNFYTWVDRRKLEGGQVWLDELENAIERCHVLLVVLSPNAVKSDYVRMEYRYAQKLGKSVIPLEYQSCQKVPIDLNSLQWVSFTGEYEKGLGELLIALSPIEITTIQSPAQPAQTPQISLATEKKETDLVTPQPAPPLPNPDLRTLYLAGVKARAEGNLDRTAILWQQILERDPHFQHDTLAPQMTRLQQALHPFRVNRLRERARQASQAGEWGQEIGAWQALLSIEPEDSEAQESKPIAEQNQNYAWMYENAVQLKEEGDLLASKLQLEMLWEDAPQYGDPKAIAEKVRAEAPKPISLKKSYKGTYLITNSSENSRPMELVIKLQNTLERVEADIFFDDETAPSISVKGTFSRNLGIKLEGQGKKRSWNGILMNLTGHFKPSGKIEGTYVLRRLTNNSEINTAKFSLS